MKLFQNKFFLICLCVAVAFCSVTSTLSLMGYTALTRNILGTVTAPARWCVTSIVNAVEGFGRYFQSIDSLEAQNKALQEQISAQEEQLRRAQLLEAENARLREYLSMKQKHPGFSFEEAMIISRESGSYMTTFTLNRGSIHGIQLNMAVVVKEGIVGSVSEVGLNWCKVSTVLDTSRTVGAYVQRSGEVGQINGEFSIRNDGYCTFSNGQSSGDVEVGDIILSVGINSIYPADLVIGKVISVGVDEYSRTMEATVESPVDFSSLQYVMIVTGYTEG
ncbi:MAG: rod shape-determining protein MreC [Clostridia bacterium]|nr:rod shape-determining protein MreC [Clostridia bacterium]